jgi:hypothetical protein
VEQFLEIGRTDGVLDINLPADAIFTSREEGAEGETWLEVDPVTVPYMRANLGPYTQHLGMLIPNYAVVSVEGDQVEVAKTSETPRAFIFLWPDWQTLRDHLASRLQTSSS